MPLYDYRCPTGELVEAFFPMQDKPDAIDCPSCGQRAVSVIPAIGPSQRNSAAMRILDATNSTAETPQVVSALTGTRTTARPTTPYTTNPLHQKLPRP